MFLAGEDSFWFSLAPPVFLVGFGEPGAGGISFSLHLRVRLCRCCPLVLMASLECSWDVPCYGGMCLLLAILPCMISQPNDQWRLPFSIPYHLNEMVSCERRRRRTALICSSHLNCSSRLSQFDAFLTESLVSLSGYITWSCSSDLAVGNSVLVRRFISLWGGLASNPWVSVLR